MPDHDTVYAEQTRRYEALISKEDYEGNIPRTLAEIVDWTGLDVVDMGAGTGRLTCMAAPQAGLVTAQDLSPAMLAITAEKLTAAGLRNWETVTSDHRSLPLSDRSADVVLSGWSICYLASSNNSNWEKDLDSVMSEIRRVLRPGGTVVILETLGTGYESPQPPDFLTSYYDKLERKFGFAHRWIRTDYRFDSAAEAEELTRFFFGDELADRVKGQGLNILPECTGIWWRRL